MLLLKNFGNKVKSLSLLLYVNFIPVFKLFVELKVDTVGAEYAVKSFIFFSL